MRETNSGVKLLFGIYFRNVHVLRHRRELHHTFPANWDARWVANIISFLCLHPPYLLLQLLSLLVSCLCFANLHPKQFMQTEMASSLASGLQKVVNMDGAASNNPKLAQLSQDTVNYDASQNARLTTDFGAKVSNTDHWLSVSTEDHYGPSLLEDGHGREKVGIPTLRANKY